MINLEQTEENIKAVIEPLTTEIKAFKLLLYPGELEDLGKPINCLTVWVKFKNVEFGETSSGNRFGNCKATQLNKVFFDIVVQSNNLRTYKDVYTIGEAVVKAVRGKCLVSGDDDTQGTAPSIISSWTFGKIGNGGACYQSDIVLELEYTDVYDAETLCRT